MPSRNISKLFLLATVTLAVFGLAALRPPTLLADPAAQGADLGPGWMCVTAPERIERGSTETILVDLELAEAPSGDTTGRLCQPVDIYETMGIGIAGVTLDNFQIDPPDTRISDRIDPATINNFTWVVNATGAEGSRHNLIVYAYIDDPARSTGFRSIARVPLRITIDAPPKTLGENILAFLNSIKEIILVVGGLLTAAIALRGQFKKLRSRADDAQANGG